MSSSKEQAQNNLNCAHLKTFLNTFLIKDRQQAGTIIQIILCMLMSFLSLMTY